MVSSSRILRISIKIPCHGSGGGVCVIREVRDLLEMFQIPDCLEVSVYESKLNNLDVSNRIDE